MPSEPIQVTLTVIEILDRLGVPYVIGGSLASSIHGLARSTYDSDIVADLPLRQVDAFVGLAQPAFYLDRTAILTAVALRTSFNLIHLQTLFKVDIFLPKDRPFDRAQLANRTLDVIATDPERSAYFAGAADTILAKLEWYRLGGDVSERQWRDVEGILAVQSGRLDLGYLRSQAAGLGVLDLLERLLEDKP